MIEQYKKDVSGIVFLKSIFTLAIEGLVRHTSQGSSLLFKMIPGGALITFLHSWFAGLIGGYYSSFFNLDYLLLIPGILRTQGIHL